MIEINLLPGKKKKSAAGGAGFKLALPDFRGLLASIKNPWLLAASATLDEVKEVRLALGGTVNDVAGALVEPQTSARGLVVQNEHPSRSRGKSFDRFFQIEEVARGEGHSENAR